MERVLKVLSFLLSIIDLSWKILFMEDNEWMEWVGKNTIDKMNKNIFTVNKKNRDNY